MDASVLPRRQQPAMLHKFEVEPPQNLRPKCRPVNLVVAARLKNVAALGARLASRAVLHGQQQRLQKRPVVLLVEKLVQPRQKLGDKLFFFLWRFRFRYVHRAGIVQPAFVLVSALFRKQRPRMIHLRIVQRSRQRHQVSVFEMNQRLAIGPRKVSQFHRPAHFFTCSGGVFAISAQLRCPSAPT